MQAEGQSETDNSVTLGLLLRKDRDEPKRSAVQRVLAHPLTIAQKIEAITTIDEKTDAAGVLQAVRAASAQIAHNHAQRIAQVIKNEIATRSLLGFLFTDFARVQKFGRRKYVLDVRLLPPRMRVDPRLEELLTTTIRSVGRDLSACLVRVIAHGWLHLTPKQYNLLVLLKRLADRVSDFDFTRLDLSSRKAIERLRGIESLFLMLHYNADTLQVIFDALQFFSEKQHEPESENTRVFGLILQLLTEDCTVPSLSNCILGLNMRKHRRYLSLRNLMRADLGEMVHVELFDFDSSIRARVEKRIDDTLESLHVLHDQLQEARLTSSYLAVDAQGRPDTGALKELYEAGTGRESDGFDEGQENLVLFVSRLLRSFNKVFSSLLNGKCVVESVGRVELFSPSFFALDFTKLRTIADRLDQELFRYSRFPLSRYLRIKEGRLQAIGTEMEVSQHIQQAVVCLADLGRTVMKILSLRVPAPAHAEVREPLQPIILHGKAFSIALENSRIQAKSLLGGLTVGHALRHAVTLCFLAGLLLQDDFVAMLLTREKRLEQELRGRLKSLAGMLDPVSYEEIASIYA